MFREAILSIDEGTTGTRAALVSSDGAATGLEYRSLSVQGPRPGVVEQDAGEIWAKTLDVCRTVLEKANRNGIKVRSVAIATQRATAVLWDKESGEPLVPAMVWQDSRHAEELADLGGEWNHHLIPRVGRTTGVRSPYLWAAHHIRETDAVRDAFREGRLSFGTIDTWLIWKLTGGRSHVTASTVACSSGAYALEDHEYAKSYIEALGFPAELLPELHQDVSHLGWTSADVLGAELEILGAIGDQHAGLAGLGCVTAGTAMCVHGTGSFVDFVTGSALASNPGAYEGALTLLGWRRGDESVFSVESFTATTGSALDWICNTLGWFESPQQISELAAGAGGSGGVTFIPALTGLRLPVVDHRVRAALSGFTTATTKANIAYGVLEGIAHSVADSVAGVSAVAGIPVESMTVGGGMSASDPLLQMQADLAGIPMRRLPGSDTASLRGAAYLCASNGELWDSVGDAIKTIGKGQVFEPRIPAGERTERRALWAARVNAELQLVRTT